MDDAITTGSYLDMGLCPSWTLCCTDVFKDLKIMFIYLEKQFYSNLEGKEPLSAFPVSPQTIPLSTNYFVQNPGKELFRKFADSSASSAKMISEKLNAKSR